ncbi:DUF4097 family beta strand repeat-containing protein [Streptomyces sp. NPDC001661]
MALSAAALGAVVLTGCAGLGPGTKASDETTVSGDISRLIVDADSGSIRVEAGSADSVRVHRQIRFHRDRPSAVPERTAGGALSLETDCDDCSVDYRITVPAGTRLDLRAGSGDINAAGLHGAVDAHVGSGDIALDNITGKVTARTGSGNVEATKLHSGAVDATSSSGDVSLAFATAPSSLAAQADSGDVRISVPKRPYRVKTSTGSGDTNVGVTNSPGATNHLDLHTGSGDITVSTS